MKHVARFVLFLLVTWSAPSVASAKPTVQIGDVRGALKSSVTRAMKKGLKNKAEVVTGPAEAVIVAKSERLGSRWQVTIEVTDRSGALKKRWKVRSKKIGRVSYLIERLIWKKLGATITRLAPRAPPPPAPAIVVPPPPPAIVEAPPPIVARPPVVPPPLASEVTGKVVLLRSEGGSAARAIASIDQAIAADDRFTLAAAEDAEIAADDLQVTLDSAVGRLRVAEDLGITAWLEVKAHYRRKRYRVTLRVLNGATGKLIDTVDLVAKTRVSLDRAVTSALKRLLEKTQVPVAPPPPPPPPVVAVVPKVKRPTKIEKTIERPPAERPWNQSTLRLRADLQLFSRNLSYNDDIFGELRPYEVIGAPAVGGAATWFVLSHFTDEWYRHLGLDVAMHYGLVLGSSNNNGDEFDTTALAWDVGVYGRLPLGEHEIGLIVGVGSERFVIQPSGDRTPGLPSVSYVDLRAAGRFRIVVTDEISLRAEGGYRLVVSAGEIRDDIWFPRASVGAADALIGGSYQLGDRFFADASFSMRRYFYTLNPEPGDPWIAGGAADQFFAFGAGIGWYL